MMKFKAATFPQAAFFFLSKSNYLRGVKRVTEETESLLLRLKWRRGLGDSV